MKHIDSILVEPRSTIISGIINKRRPLAYKLEQVIENLQKLKGTLQGLEQQRQGLLSKIDDYSITG